MELVTILIIAAGIVSAVKGLVWFIQALRDGRITMMEVLNLIEYEIGIVVNLLWMWAILRLWGLATVVPLTLAAAAVALPSYAVLAAALAFFIATLVLMAGNRPGLAIAVGGVGLTAMAFLGVVDLTEITLLLRDMLLIIGVIDTIELAALLGSARR